ncbi:predicted protein [Vibrio cholerae RC385]|nr:predicted protein [Vibrio cholerae RC385]
MEKVKEIYLNVATNETVMIFYLNKTIGNNFDYFGLKVLGLESNIRTVNFANIKIESD